MRTDKGTIAKIDDVEWDLLYEISSMKPKYKYWIDRNKYRTEFIVKHSPNIIDLIEEGDYVNGEKIIEIDASKDWIDIGREVLFQKDIKTIATKEQMKSIEYVVKE